jgi:hypothetical protein
MIRYCYNAWESNKDNLEGNLRTSHHLRDIEYIDLVKTVVRFILGEDWDADRITEIDNGDYQGTLLFLIPQDTYHPCEYEYLMTYVWYGSCTGCDTLRGITSKMEPDTPPAKRELQDLMTLCKDIVMHMVKPFNSGWAHDSDFDEVAIDD